MNDREFETRLEEAVKRISAKTVHIEDPPPCPHCGRCLFLGGPCCPEMAVEIRRYQQSPEYQERMRQQQERRLAEKRANKLAKRARRLARLVAKRMTTWEAYDQFLADQSAWEGMIER